MQQPESVEEEEEAVKVLVYYGNAAADGFEQKEVEIKGLTPKNLISELAKMNVVSIDTEVKNFEQDGKALKLDLFISAVSFVQPVTERSISRISHKTNFFFIIIISPFSTHTLFQP